MKLNKLTIGALIFLIIYLSIGLYDYKKQIDIHKTNPGNYTYYMECGDKIEWFNEDFPLKVCGMPNPFISIYDTQEKRFNSHLDNVIKESLQ